MPSPEAVLRRRIVERLRADTMLSQHAGVWAHAADIAEVVVGVVDVEAVRADERRRVDAAIGWETSCVGCADRYDALIKERAAGSVEAAAAILAGVRALESTLGPKAVAVVAELAAQWGAGPAESHAQRPKSLSAPSRKAGGPVGAPGRAPC